MEKREVHVKQDHILSIASELDKMRLLTKFFEYSQNAPKKRIVERFESSVGSDVTAKVNSGLLTMSFRSRRSISVSKLRQKFWEIYKSKENQALKDYDPNKVTLEKYMFQARTTTLSYYNDDISLMLNRMGKLTRELRDRNSDFLHFMDSDFSRGRDDEIYIKRKVVYESLKARLDLLRGVLEEQMFEFGHNINDPQSTFIIGQFQSNCRAYPQLKEDMMKQLITERFGAPGDAYYNTSTSVYVVPPAGKKSGLAVAYEGLKERAAGLVEVIAPTISEMTPPLLFAASLEDKVQTTAIERVVNDIRGKSSVEDFEI
jgi:hypothetical protein